MVHLDLFSGIGGFAYAIDQVFDNVEHIFCDNNKFCQEVLKKHWPNSKIYEDIREITMENYTLKGADRGGESSENKNGDRFIANTKHNGGTTTKAVGENSGSQPEGTTREELSKPEFEGVSSLRTMETRWDIITGGFPCQPFSQAGKRKGTDDNRYLWPEMLRIIQLTNPTWVIAENVRGLLTIEGGMVFEQVCLDLEASGYEVQPLIIPAVSVNAPHRRDRVWFIAKNTKCERGCRGMEGSGQILERQSAKIEDAGPSWEENWIEVATRLCGVFNGLSLELDKDMNDGIYSKYATTFNKITRQDLPCLWQGFQSETIRESIGRFNPLQNKDYLFTVLWQYSLKTKGQNNPAFESAEVQEAYLRNVWRTGEVGCPPQGWRYNEQYAREHSDTLSQLSHEVALATAEVWKKYNARRVDRLKSLGNAIVPQVAIEIMKSIKLSI